MFADGTEGGICICAYDRAAAKSAVIAMTAGQAADFARALLDAAMSLQEEIAALVEGGEA